MWDTRVVHQNCGLLQVVNESVRAQEVGDGLPRLIRIEWVRFVVITWIPALVGNSVPSTSIGHALKSPAMTSGRALSEATCTTVEMAARFS
eukprot:5585547-Pyramimonas_sp.AAC.1